MHRDEHSRCSHCCYTSAGVTGPTVAAALESGWGTSEEARRGTASGFGSEATEEEAEVWIDDVGARKGIRLAGSSDEGGYLWLRFWILPAMQPAVIHASASWSQLSCTVSHSCRKACI